MIMKYIGAHVSAAGGVQNTPLNAVKIGAKAFALFTKNQRQWNAKPLTQEAINGFKKNLAESGIRSEHVLPHDSYLINIGNPEEEKREKSLNALLDEAQRVEQLGLNLLNFHPGSHLKQISEEQCMDYIAEGINRVIDQTENVIMVLETTAGQGSNIGYRFEQLAYIIERVKNKDRVGTCIDTCHIFAAGYDIRTEAAYNETMKSFSEIIGFDKLHAIHLNDSKSEFASRVDRHHSIGQGNLSMETFTALMNDPRLDDIPIIMETIDDTIWEEEIKKLYSLVK
jgi:deoxyribonuclease-4